MEYKILTGDSPINENQLADLSKQGWQLVTIIPWRGMFYFYLKRPVA